MTLDSEAFEINRWHSPEYVESWVTNNIREANRRTLRKNLVSLLPFELQAPLRMLDLGTGSGGLSVEILGTYVNARLVCLDFSEAMLAHARQRLAPFSGQVTFIKSDSTGQLWYNTINNIVKRVFTK